MFLRCCFSLPVSEILQRSKDETDVDSLVKNLQTSFTQKDLSADPAALFAVKHLLQWTANLALHLASSAPEFKLGRRGPGVNVFF